MQTWVDEWFSGAMAGSEQYHRAASAASADSADSAASADYCELLHVVYDISLLLRAGYCERLHVVFGSLGACMWAHLALVRMAIITMRWVHNWSRASTSGASM